jgi:hypothetical protein
MDSSKTYDVLPLQPDANLPSAIPVKISQSLMKTIMENSQSLNGNLFLNIIEPKKLSIGA